MSESADSLPAGRAMSVQEPDRSTPTRDVKPQIRLSYMPRHQHSEGNDLNNGIAAVTLHPFMPMMFNIRSLSAATTRADKAPASHESYCSAPPLVLPPRPSRDQEARRPRAPIWLGMREPPDSEAETVLAISDADAIDVKPDVAKLAAATCNARPAAPAKTSPSFLNI